MKAEQRRARREKWAAKMAVTNPLADWEQISPVLEKAMDQLGTLDRNTILLRYFQGMDVEEAARALGLSAIVVAKRSQRAVEKLRRILAKRGVNSPAEAIGAALAGNAVRAAPGNLTGKIGAAQTAAGAAKVLTVGIVTKAIAAGVVLAIGAAAGVAIHSYDSKAPLAALSPSSSAEEQMILAAIWRLRHFTPQAFADEWAGQIRILIEIGRPAVPELVAEMDRANKEEEVRALAFVLRNIGDARAVPALIAALPRTDANWIDGDDQTVQASAETERFMRAHQLNPPGLFYSGPPEFDLGSSTDEILAGLKTIPRHQEGPWNWYDPQHYIDATSSNGVNNVVAVNHPREDLARQWQAWWKTNQSLFVSDAEMASLTVVNHDSAAIESAGMAEMGPIVPTGAPYHLSPVREYTVVDKWPGSVRCAAAGCAIPGEFLSHAGSVFDAGCDALDSAGSHG